MTSLAFVLDRRSRATDPDRVLAMLEQSVRSDLSVRRVAAHGPFALGVADRDGWPPANRNLDESASAIAGIDGHIHRPELGHTHSIDRLLDGVERWGHGAAGRLLGEFVGVHWSAATRRLLVIRDHLGIRPFHLHVGDDVIVGATEIGCLLAHPDVSSAPDPVHLRAMLGSGTPRIEKTVYRDITRLPAGSVLEVSEVGVRQRPYWAPSKEDWLSGTDSSAIHDLIGASFTQAVDDRIGAEEQVSVDWDGWQASAAVSGRAAWLVDRSERTADTIRTLALGDGVNDRPYPAPGFIGVGRESKLDGLVGAPARVDVRDLFERSELTRLPAPPLARLRWSDLRAEDRVQPGPNGPSTVSLSPFGGTAVLDPGSGHKASPRTRVTSAKIDDLTGAAFQHQLDAAALDAAVFGQDARFPYLDARFVRLALALPVERTWWASHGAATGHRALSPWLPGESTRRWGSPAVTDHHRDQTLELADSLIGRRLEITRRGWTDQEAIVRRRALVRADHPTHEDIDALARIVAIEAWAELTFGGAG